jgi:hypothetical protein
MYEHHSERLLPLRDFVQRLLAHAGFAATIIGGSLTIGIVGYHVLARMSWVDSFLNAAMILGGMGPVGDLPTSTSKIFAGCYALYAGVVFIAVAGILIAPVAHRILHKMHLDD